MVVRWQYVAFLAAVVASVASPLSMAAEHPTPDHSSNETAITHAMVSAYRHASDRANVYCGTHKEASFPVSKNKQLQRIFNVDQAIRTYDVVSQNGDNGSVWSSQAVKNFWRAEAGYLQNLLAKPGAFKHIVSGPLSPGTFELQVISMHVSRHAPDTARIVADRFRKLANGRAFMTGMAATIEFDIKHRRSILRTPLATAKLPQNSSAADCFSVAHNYYTAATLSQNKRLAARVLADLHGLAAEYGYVGTPGKTQ